MKNKWRYILGITMPIILWAWAGDNTITVTQNMPYAYSLTAPSADTIFMAYRSGGADSVYQTIMISTDSGKTWQEFYSTAFVDSNHYYPTEVFYYGDTLCMTYSAPVVDTYGIALDFLPFDGSDTIKDTLPLYVDTIMNLRYAMVKNGDSVGYLYISGVVKRGDSTILFVSKGKNTQISNTNIMLFYIEKFVNLNMDLNLADFDAYYVGQDSVMLVFTETVDTPGYHAVYADVYLDTMGIYFIPEPLASFKKIKETHESKEAVFAYTCGMLNWAILDSVDLYFFYSADKALSSIDSVEFPYNDNYDEIQMIDMVQWHGLYCFTSGFNLSFVGVTPDGNYNVWFSDISIDDDTLAFYRTPVKISDSGYSYYIFNSALYYNSLKPRIKDIQNKAIPYIVWNYDYSTWNGVFLFYDSTAFRIDGYNYYSGIKNHREIYEGKLSIQNTRSRLILSSNLLKGDVQVSILDATGRVVERKTLKGLNGRGTINIKGLKKGVYFVIVKEKSRNLKGKFVKLK